MDDMLETMYAAPGIGLAAVQIGVLKRAIVIDLSKEDEKKNPLFIVNPEITFKSKEFFSYEEGCLSIPNQFAEVKRPNSCKVSFLDYDGKQKEIYGKCIESLLKSLKFKSQRSSLVTSSSSIQQFK